MNQENGRNTAEQNRLDIFTALSIFVNHAPRLIDEIVDAAQTHNLSLAEETAAKLSLYSDDAQLTCFTRDINTFIIAVREQRLPVVRSQAEKLRESFEQMTRSANIVAF